MERRILYGGLILSVVVLVIKAYLFNVQTTILLVRHAEKESSAVNPNLSDPQGTDRAERLIAVAKEAGISAIYTTEFCRTAQTAQPLAVQLNLPLIVVENGMPEDQLSDCQPEISVPVERLPAAIDTTPKLVAEVLSKHAGEVVLIVGHSDSVPRMIQELGASPLCPDYFEPA
jgi:broad specificity phosphatase PhoE